MASVLDNMAIITFAVEGPSLNESIMGCQISIQRFIEAALIRKTQKEGDATSDPVMLRLV